MKLTYLGLLLLFASGCAFPPAKLKVKYDQARAKLGPLSSIKSLEIQVVPFEDKRLLPHTIGYQRNGFGMNMGDIITTRPVAELVREAIAITLEKNGHIVTNEKKNLKISGTIETFWFESQVNAFTLEFMGTIAVDLTLEDSQTNNSLFSRRYSGYHNAEFYMGHHKEMTQVMNSALENLTTQIATDTQLIEALQSYSGP